MATISLTGNALDKAEIEYHGMFWHTIGSIQRISFMIRMKFVTQLVVYQHKLWRLLFLVFKMSSAVFNIWIVTHINPSFILLIIMMAQIKSDLFGVVIKLNNTQPRTVLNATNMRIMLELSIEDGQCQVFFILCLVLLFSGEYIFNQL